MYAHRSVDARSGWLTWCMETAACLSWVCFLFGKPYRFVVGDVFVPVQCSAVEGVVDLAKLVVVDVESVQIRC